MSTNLKLKARIFHVWGYHPDKLVRTLKELGMEEPRVAEVVNGKLELSDEDKKRFAMALSCDVDEIFEV